MISIVYNAGHLLVQTIGALRDTDSTINIITITVLKTTATDSVVHMKETCLNLCFRIA